MDKNLDQRAEADHACTEIDHMNLGSLEDMFDHLRGCQFCASCTPLLTMVVLELLRWQAPASLVLAIVLLAANPRIPQRGDVEFVECFAGDGQVSLALWGAGLTGSSHDLRYSKLMDFCSSHGFAFLGKQWVLSVFLCVCLLNGWRGVIK